MTCKVCKRDLHYCSSCGYDPYMYDDYCSKECWVKSDEYKFYLDKLNNFWNSLSEDQKKNLFDLWGSKILIDDKWEFIIDDIWKINV